MSDAVASRLRRRAGALGRGDPWERIAALPAEELVPLLADEAAETVAVALSRLPVPRAAEVLAQMAEEGQSFGRMLREPAAREAFGAFMEKRKPDFSKV